MEEVDVRRMTLRIESFNKELLNDFPDIKIMTLVGTTDFTLVMAKCCKHFILNTIEYLKHLLVSENTGTLESVLQQYKSPKKEGPQA